MKAYLAKRVISGLALFSLLLPSAANACKPVMPQYRNNTPAFMILSANQQAMIKVVPERYAPNPRGEWVVSRPSRMEAYQLNNDGQLKFLWAEKNLYPFLSGGMFQLSDDGLYMVRIFNTGPFDNKNALTIFRNGKIVRQYAPKDFGLTQGQFKMIPCLGSPWIKGDSRQALNGYYLSFQTINGKKWGFDIRQQPKQL